MISLMFAVITLAPMQRVSGLPTHYINYFAVTILFVASYFWALRRGYSWWFGPTKGLMTVLLFLLLGAFLLSYVVGLSAGRYEYTITDPIAVMMIIVRLFMVFIICASARPDARGWKLILWTILVLGVLQAAICGLQYRQVGGVRPLSLLLWGAGESQMLGDESRVIGTIGNPNGAGCMMAVSIGAALVIMFYSRGLVRRYLIPLAAVIFMSIANLLWTLSRGSLFSVLGGLAGFGLVAILFGRHRRTALIATGVLGGLVVFFFANMEDLPIPDRMKDVFRPGEAEGTAYGGMSSRLEIWKRRVEQINEDANPLTGYGPTMTLSVHRRFVDNDTLNFYFKAGLIGAMIWLGMKVLTMCRSFTNVFRCRTRDDFQVALFLFYALVVFTLFGLTADTTLGAKLGDTIMVCFGLSCAQAIMLREREQEDVEAYDAPWIEGADPATEPEMPGANC